MTVGQLPLVTALAVLLVANVVLTWVFGRRASAGSGGGPARIDRRAGVVECRSCGSVNDLDYRYCGECVTELPTAGGAVDVDVRPVRRNLD